MKSKDSGSGHGARRLHPVRLRALLATAGAGTLLAGAAAFADSPAAPAAATDQASPPVEEVVVTGTLIRNAAPVGSTATLWAISSRAPPSGEL